MHTNADPLALSLEDERSSAGLQLITVPNTALNECSLLTAGCWRMNMS
jgi:hypothetical protein